MDYTTPQRSEQVDTFRCRTYHSNTTGRSKVSDCHSCKALTNNDLRVKRHCGTFDALKSRAMLELLGVLPETIEDGDDDDQNDGLG